MKHLLQELLKLKSDYLNEKEKELYNKMMDIKVEELDNVLSKKSPLSLELTYIIEEFIWARNFNEIAEVNELISLTKNMSKEQNKYFMNFIDIISLESKIGKIIVEKAPNYILSKEYNLYSELYLTGHLLFGNLEKYVNSVLDLINSDESEFLSDDSENERYDINDIGYINRESLAQVYDSLDQNQEEENNQNLEKLTTELSKNINLGNMNNIIKIMLNNYKLKRYTMSGLSGFCNSLYVNAKIIMESKDFIGVGDVLSKENYIYMCNAHAQLQDKQKILAKERKNFFTKEKKD